MAHKRRASESTGAPAPGGAARGYLAPLLIVVAVVAAYANSLGGPFVFDDVQNILENPTLRSLWPPQRVLFPPAGFGIASRPIVNLSLALNHAVSGEAVWSYHLTNVLAHALAALTLFGVVRRTLTLPRLRDRFAGAATPLACASAILWALHPLQTQAVTYVVQRCESMMGLGFLLVFYCALRGWAAESPRRWHACALLAFLLGIGTKEVIVVAPPLLLLYDILFLHGNAREAWRRSRGLYLGLAIGIALAAALIARLSVGMLQSEKSAVAAGAYAITQPAVILHYLRLAVWPDRLSLDYAWPAASLARAWPAVIALLALLAATVWGLVRRRPVAFLGAWFFATLAPSSSFVPLPDLAFEHRMYLALASAVVLAIVGGYSLVARRPLRWRRTAIVALAGLTLAAGARTVARNRGYRSAVAIWSDTVAKQPRNARARLSLGVALDRAGRKSEAMAQLEAALEIDPSLAKAHCDYAIGLMETGDPQRAIDHLRQALRTDPGYVQAHSNLGIALCQLGRLEEGMAELREALRLDPNCVEAHFNLSIALRELGHEDEARRHFETAYRLNPRYVQPDGGMR
jgi:protein O-mannosyl-transferase